MLSDETCGLLRRVLAAQRFDEITVGICGICLRPETWATPPCTEAPAPTQL